jgi:hypothetical protein
VSRVERRLTVVYLGGFGRSGSTLLERLLGECPGWGNVGELVDLARTVGPADELCGCGEPFSRCPVWQAVGDRAFGGWSTEVFTRLAALRDAAARQRHLPAMLLPGRRAPAGGPRAELQAAYTRIYESFAEVSGCRVVVDASKGPALGLALAGAPGLDVRVINLVRDPRAVAWSWERRVARPQATGTADDMWRIPTQRSAAQWTALQLEMEAIRRLGRVPSVRLRYEDLVVDPRRAVRGAVERLGLPTGAAALSHVERTRVYLSPSHGLSGNPSRFRSGRIDLRTDDRWAHEMPATRRAVATALSLPLLAAYGYPVSTTVRRDRTPSRKRHHLT